MVLKLCLLRLYRVCVVLLFMPVGSAAADFSFHFGRPGTVRPRDISFLFGFGFHFGVRVSGSLLAPPENTMPPVITLSMSSPPKFAISVP